MIAEYWILTAAHCVNRRAPNDHKGLSRSELKRRVEALAGISGLYLFDVSRQNVELERAIVHPAWTGLRVMRNDLALVKVRPTGTLMLPCGFGESPEAPPP